MSSLSKSDFPSGAHAFIKAARGPELSCKGWGQEAVLRLLMNSLDQEVKQSSPETAEQTSGIALDAQSFDAVVRFLRQLESNETVVIRSGEPAGIVRTHNAAPRTIVYSAPSACESNAANGTRAEAALMAAFREMSGVSWLRIGVQEIVALLFEMFLHIGEQHLSAATAVAARTSSAADLGPALAGRLILSGGIGEFGGAQPLAATMAGAAFLGVDADPECIKRLLRRGSCDFMVNSLDEALRICKNAVRKRENISVGLVGDCAEIIAELASRGVVPDIFTDLTSRDLRAYVPSDPKPAESIELRERDLQGSGQDARDAGLRQLEAMLRLQKMGSFVIDFGNNLRTIAIESGLEGACNVAGVEDFLRALLAKRGPLRCVALSGARADIAAVDELALQMFPRDERLRLWINSARQRLRFQGLPARLCWLSPEQQVEFAVASNGLVAQGKTKAPLAFVQDRFEDALPTWPHHTETANAEQGEAARPAWLNRFLNVDSAPTLLSILNTREGKACVQQMFVADGSEDAATRIERVLNKTGLEQ